MNCTRSSEKVEFISNYSWSSRGSCLIKVFMSHVPTFHPVVQDKHLMPCFFLLNPFSNELATLISTQYCEKHWSIIPSIQFIVLISLYRSDRYSIIVKTTTTLDTFIRFIYKKINFEIEEFYSFMRGNW